MTFDIRQSTIHKPQALRQAQGRPSSPKFNSYRFDLYFCPQGQGGHLHGRAGRGGLGEVLLEDLVEDGEVTQVGEVDGELDNVVQVTAAGCEDARQVMQYLLDLLLEGAVNQLAAGRVERDLPGGEYQLPAADPLAVRTDGLRGLVGVDDGAHG